MEHIDVLQKDIKSFAEHFYLFDANEFKALIGNSRANGIDSVYSYINTVNKIHNVLLTYFNEYPFPEFDAFSKLISSNNLKEGDSEHAIEYIFMLIADMKKAQNLLKQLLASPKFETFVQTNIDIRSLKRQMSFYKIRHNGLNSLSEKMFYKIRAIIQKCDRADIARISSDGVQSAAEGILKGTKTSLENVRYWLQFD